MLPALDPHTFILTLNPHPHSHPRPYTLTPHAFTFDPQPSALPPSPTLPLYSLRVLGVETRSSQPASRAPVYRPKPTSRPNSRPASRPHSRPPSIRAAGAQTDGPGAAPERDSTSPRRRSTAKRHMVTVGAELAPQHSKRPMPPQRSRPAAPDTALPGKLAGPPPPLDPARPAPDSALHLPRLATHASPHAHEHAHPPASPRRIAPPSTSRSKVRVAEALPCNTSSR